MKNSCLFTVIISVSLACNVCQANDVTFRYSLDLGSDLDLSDPVTTDNNKWDCGDVLLESTPTRHKNDSDIDGEGYTYGWPTFAELAPQPPTSDVANSANQYASSTDVRSKYGAYWDMDDDDQIDLQIPSDMISNPRVLLRSDFGKTRAQWEGEGIHYQPQWVAVSFEDDQPNGWYKSGQIPTKQLSSKVWGTSSMKDEVCRATGEFGKWGSPIGIRDEKALGLKPNPTFNDSDVKYNDDVDALDIEDHKKWYMTSDHEANYGFDPGSVLMVDFEHETHAAPVLDDKNNIGVTIDTDIAGLEFCSVGKEKFQELFGYTPSGMGDDDDVLCLMFSVKDIDYDCMPNGWTPGGDNDPSIDDFYGRLNGGLDTKYIYISDLAGKCVELGYMGESIDAITVDAPEPGTAVLMFFAAAAGVVYIARYRRQRQSLR
jgi:hypothetical protein